MGSVITYDDKCPKCKQETGFSDFYYKTSEEYFACQNSECSFSYSYQWKRDKDHKLITRDGSDNYEFSNLIMVETIYENGVKTVKELNQNKDE
jgi:hypothetical protein